MALPNVIGIGAEKCGSTWLYDLLRNHPDVFMSERRKEIDFFNRNYNKGLRWYESFFPIDKEADDYSVIGEFSPSYFFYPECADRIHALGSVEKLLLILRNPAEQIYSYYGQAVRVLNYQKTFEEFLEEKPIFLEKGFHGKHLKPFADAYARNKILCLKLDEAVKNTQTTKQNISHFLNIKSDKFVNDAGSKRSNHSYIPRYKKLNYMAGKARRLLIRHDQDWAIGLAKSVGIPKLLEVGANSQRPAMKIETRQRLRDFYQKDIYELTNILNMDFKAWMEIPDG